MAEKESVKFEKSLEKLEKIVAELEDGELSLDEALARYEEGAKTLKLCYEALRRAEKRVEKLLKDEEGGTAVEPFDEADADEGNDSTESAN